MRKTVAAATIGTLLLVGGSITYGALDAYDVVPGVFTLSPAPPSPQPVPTAAAVAAEPTPAQADAAKGELPNSEQVQQIAASLSGKIKKAATDARAAAKAQADAEDAQEKPNADQDKGEVEPSLRVGVSVLDVATGKELANVAAGTPLTPASSTKVLSAVAALQLSLIHI